MVTVAVLLVPTAVIAQVTPASELETEHVGVTLPAKLLIEVKVSVDVPLPPGAIVKLLGEALSEKSPAGVMKLDTVDHAAIWSDGATACTSQ
jgi:hypothetical protein